MSKVVLVCLRNPRMGPRIHKFLQHLSTELIPDSIKPIAAKDVADTLSLALNTDGPENVNVRHQPRLLADHGPPYVSSEVRDWLDEYGIPDNSILYYRLKIWARSRGGHDDS